MTKRPSRQSTQQTTPNPGCQTQITSALIEQMRGLISEGCPRKALNLLLSSGIHSSSNPEVMKKLQDLHPPGIPVRATSLPGSTLHGLPPPLMMTRRGVKQ